MSDTLPDVPATHDTIDGIPAPSANPALFGHPSIRSFLAQAYQSGHMHHALLLEGPQGVGGLGRGGELLAGDELGTARR